MDQESVGGRRVFFVQPNPLIRSELIPELVRQEYETCWISFADAPRFLNQYPGCVVLIHVDGLVETEWRALISRYHGGETDVRFGVLTSTPHADVFRRYQDLKLPCGVTRLSLLLKDCVSAVLRVLESQEARGRRRYLRVTCSDNAMVNLSTPSGVVRGHIVDISTVGMACVFRPDHNWPARTALPSLQLQLKGALCLVDGFVMGSRPAAQTNERVYIVMFDPKAPPIQRDKIRVYIQKVLQAEAGPEREAKIS